MEKSESTKKEKKSIGTKPLDPPKETPIAGMIEPALVKALKRASIVTLEQFNALSDNEVLNIPGIDGTRLLRIFAAIGRELEKPEEN